MEERIGGYNGYELFGELVNETYYGITDYPEGMFRLIGSNIQLERIFNLKDYQRALSEKLRLILPFEFSIEEYLAFC